VHVGRVSQSGEGVLWGLEWEYSRPHTNAWFNAWAGLARVSGVMLMPLKVGQSQAGEGIKVHTLGQAVRQRHKDDERSDTCKSSDKCPFQTQPKFCPLCRK
jgi:hypothetical protein